MSTSRAPEYATGNIPVWTFGDKVRKARDVAGLDQKEFAERIGITASSLAAYETGRSHPRFKDAPNIAKSIQLLTGIPYEWFLVEDGENGGPRRARTDDPRINGTSLWPDLYGDTDIPPVVDLNLERERRRTIMVEVSA